jgi:hypothetical protein
MAALVQAVATAAAEAIRNQAPSLTSDVGRLKSVTPEFQHANNGAVIDST